jgi:excisionase family DNA binding protein
MRTQRTLADDDRLAVTVPAAAALVDVSRSTGYQLVASGEWPAIRIGRSIRVPMEALRTWVERRRRVADPTALDVACSPVDEGTTGAARGGDPVARRTRSVD